MRLKFYGIATWLCMATAPILWSQDVSKMSPANSAPNSNIVKRSEIGFMPKTTQCVDTLRYVETKEFVLGNENFYQIRFDQNWGEGAVQVFLLNGTTHNLNGVEFYGRNTQVSGATTMRASVYNVDANNNPTTLLGSGTLNITATDTLFKYRHITFSNPISVSSNYAIMITPENTTGNAQLRIFMTDILPNQPADENLARIKDGATFITVPAYAAAYLGGNYNFEFVISPIVSYSLNSKFTMNPSPGCAGSAIAFTATSTPTSILTNRMYNINAFNTHFLSEPDSTYAWDFTGVIANAVWAPTTNYTYATAGSKNVDLYTLSGIGKLCIDVKDTTFTIGTTTAAPASIAGNTSTCATGVNTYTASPVSGATSYVWTLPSGWSGTSTTNTISATAGSTGGTISVAAVGPCGTSSATTINVSINSAPTADFSYGLNAYCNNASNASAIIGAGSTSGTFSSTSGIDVNPNTGEINFALSLPGTYTITNNVAAVGACPSATSNYGITIHALPSVSATAVASTLCEGASTTLTASGANTYTWSPASGLSSTNGASVTATPQGAVTYTVTGTDANNCSADAQVSLTVNLSPTVSQSALPMICIYNSSYILSGGLPVGGTYSGTGVTAGSFDPAVAGIGTHAITYSFTDANGCEGTAVQNQLVDACLSIEEVANSFKLSISPVPSTDFVNVSFDMEAGKDLNITLHSVDGKLVYSSKMMSNTSNTLKLQVSHLASGVYYLNVSDMDIHFGGKIIKH